MTTDADDDRIVDAITHLHTAMSLLNAAGALQSAAHVATAIFCVPAPRPLRPEPSFRRYDAVSGDQEMGSSLRRPQRVRASAA
jgi:hypothetical protein